MTQSIDDLRDLRRPRLLIRAARRGTLDYNRNRDLRRVLRSEATPGPANSVPQLIDMEAEQERMRTAEFGSYSAARHIEILIALMSEARLLA